VLPQMRALLLVGALFVAAAIKEDDAWNFDQRDQSAPSADELAKEPEEGRVLELLPPPQ
jgi:hypothetical protein